MEGEIEKEWETERRNGRGVCVNVCMCVYRKRKEGDIEEE